MDVSIVVDIKGLKQYRLSGPDVGEVLGESDRLQRRVATARMDTDQCWWEWLGFVSPNTGILPHDTRRGSLEELVVGKAAIGIQLRVREGERSVGAQHQLDRIGASAAVLR